MVSTVSVRKPITKKPSVSIPLSRQYETISRWCSGGMGRLPTRFNVAGSTDSTPNVTAFESYLQVFTQNALRNSGTPFAFLAKQRIAENHVRLCVTGTNFLNLRNDI